MKLALGAAAAAFLFVAAASAQQTTIPAPSAPVVVPPSHCGDLTPEPSLPDGATANAAAIAAGDAAYQAWATASQTTIQCKRAETQEAQAIAEARVSSHNASVSRLNALTASWLAERNEYCGRPRSHCAPVAPAAATH